MVYSTEESVKEAVGQIYTKFVENYDQDTFFDGGAQQIAGVHTIVLKLVALIQGIFSVHSEIIEKMIG